MNDVFRMNFYSIKSILLCFTCSIILLAPAIASVGAQVNRPVSSWKDYFPYGDVLEVVALDNGAFARTNYAVFKLDSETNLIKRFTPVQGLTQSNPTAISWYEASEILVIGYANGNIDLVTDAGIYNMPDIVTSNLLGDKGIRSIRIIESIEDPENDCAYLACGFGVVVIDLSKLEVKDTWFITGQQNLRTVQSVIKHDSLWVVATDAGVYEAPIDHPFLSSADAWSRWDDLPESPSSYVTDVVYFHDDILVQLGEGLGSRLWTQTLNGSWQLFPNWPSDGAELWGIDTSNSTLLLGRCCGVERYDTNYNLIIPTNALGEWMQVRDVAYDKQDSNIVWIASRIGGLLRYIINPSEGGVGNGVFVPKGPPTADVRKIDCWNSNLWFATGGVDETWTNLYNTTGVHGLVDGNWVEVTALESENSIIGIKDYLDLSIDPLDPNHIILGSFEEGLIEVKNGQMTEIWNSSNSTILEGSFGGNPRSAIGGVDFDLNGNLWFTNAYTSNPIQVRLADGTFIAMNLGDDLGSNDLIGSIMATNDGYIWVILPRGGGLLVYDYAGTPSNSADDDWRFLNTDPLMGGLPSNDIFSIEEDLDGEIWVGTGSGPAIFYRSASLFEGNETTASQILIQQDGNYQYLLETETITAIIIDGGNRKWVGTAGAGVYVLSGDGLTIEHHFSTDNSPIPSDNVLDIAIDHSNGEVFIATVRGTISYLGEATNWDTDMESVHVFPNPVTQYYDGNITIDGLDFESTVHITDGAGRVITTIQSMGGRAVWDGRLDNGTLAPYGVYLIFITDSDGKTSASTKLAITR